MVTKSELHKLAPDLEDRYVEALFGFPHVLRGLDLFWGSKDCVSYMENLLIDKRGNRQGFPPDVVFAIQKLIDTHNENWPEYKSHIAAAPFTFG